MPHPSRIVRAAGALALLVLLAVPAAAQRRVGERDWMSDCQRWGRERDTERYCDVVESTMAAPGGTLVIDGRANGGVEVFGSNRRDISIRAKIQVNARSQERAEALAEEIKIRSEGGRSWIELRMGDAWVWDMYRQSRFVSSVHVVTFKDVNVEELPKKEL